MHTSYEERTYKTMKMKIRKHWSGNRAAFVFYSGEMYFFPTIKGARRFIDTITELTS